MTTYYRSNIMEALEWLTEHQNDPEDDDNDLDSESIETGNNKKVKIMISIYLSNIIKIYINYKYQYN